MDSVPKNKSFIQPKTMAELLPELSSILSKDSRLILTAKKQPRPNIAQTRKPDTVLKPLTIAELRTAITALKVQSPKSNPPPNTATKKLHWNSSVRPEKTKSHKAEGQLRHQSVRKVLNFQPKPKPVPNVRATVKSSETPKFPEPEIRAKKPLHLQAKNNVRISGICNIPPTPVRQNKVAKPQLKWQQCNKENKTYQANINRETIATPKNIIQKKFKESCPDTPQSNLSFISNGDASFLLKEKEINDIEERTRALTEESTLENIAEISPPVSTPFKEYRNVKEFFNSSCDTEKSYNDNTIMSFDKVSVNKESGERERVESVIVSLCDMLNKAALTNTDKINTSLDDLLELEIQTLHNIQMIEYGVLTLNNIKELQLKSLQYVRKLKNEKKDLKPDVNANSVQMKNETPANKGSNPAESPILRASVIKIKTPAYKIPRKNLCLRKKVIGKYMSNISEEMETPVKCTDKALNMYMQIKEKMNFLNTPLVKHRNLEPPDTPSLTSQNLQKQLDKLYNGS